MAKKRITTQNESSISERLEPPNQERVVRRTVLTIKGTDAWKDWLDRLSKHVRTQSSTIVDHALIDYARKVGFSDPPPER